MFPVVNTIRSGDCKVDESVFQGGNNQSLVQHSYQREVVISRSKEHILDQSYPDLDACGVLEGECDISLVVKLALWNSCIDIEKLTRSAVMLDGLGMKAVPFMFGRIKRVLPGSILMFVTLKPCRPFIPVPISYCLRVQLTMRLTTVCCRSIIIDMYCWKLSYMEQWLPH